MVKTNANQPERPGLLTERQAAARLGISRAELSKLRRLEALPYYLLHRSPNGRELRRYDPRALDEWLANRVKVDLPPAPKEPRQRIDERIRPNGGVPGWDGIDRLRGKPKRGLD